MLKNAPDALRQVHPERSRRAAHEPAYASGQMVRLRHPREGGIRPHPPL